MFTMEFTNNGKTFSAYNAALIWLKSMGYSHGTLTKGLPVPIRKGEFYSKWHATEYGCGKIESKDFIRGNVTIVINNFE